MKYKCITTYYKKSTPMMSSGDIVTVNGNQLYNITTGKEYKNLSVSELFLTEKCLEPITDDGPIYNINPKTVSEIYTDTDRFKDITKKMIDTFRRKNHDYGNSFEQSLNEEGLAAARIRMGDKWNRFKNLSKLNKAEVSDESLRDTLLDLSNYCIMTVMWLDKQEQD